MIAYVFTIEACRSSAGVPQMMVPLRDENMEMSIIVEHVLGGFALSFQQAHPAWFISTDPDMWDATAREPAEDIADAAFHSELVSWYDLVPKEGAITL